MVMYCVWKSRVVYVIIMLFERPSMIYHLWGFSQGVNVDQKISWMPSKVCVPMMRKHFTAFYSLDLCLDLFHILYKKRKKNSAYSKIQDESLG